MGTLMLVVWAQLHTFADVPERAKVQIVHCTSRNPRR